MLCEDLLAFSFQLRQNEACPHAPRDDGHRLSMDDFVVRDRICTFKAGSKSHSNMPRAEYDKFCLFDDETTKGLLRHIFYGGRRSIGNERKAVLSRSQLDKYGIMQYITDVSDKYTRGKWRGIGASSLNSMTTRRRCARRWEVRLLLRPCWTTCRATRPLDTSRTSLKAKNRGGNGKITMEDGKRNVVMY